MKALLMVSIIVLSGCDGMLDVAAACPYSNEYRALASCMNSWSCDKTAKDVERYYELDDLDTKCRMRAYDARKEKERKP